MQPDRFGDCLGLVTSPFDVHAGNSFVARNDKLVPLCSDINLSWFKRGNAVSAEDNDAVPIDDDAVPNHDSVPRRHGGVVRRNGRADGSFGGWPGRPAPATETGGHRFLECIESGALADGLGERIAFEGGDQDVAAEGHFGVFGLAGQLRAGPVTLSGATRSKDKVLV